MRESEREVGGIFSRRCIIIYLSSAPFAVRGSRGISSLYGQLYFRVVRGMGLSHLQMRSPREKGSSPLVLIHSDLVQWRVSNAVKTW